MSNIPSAVTVTPHATEEIGTLARTSYVILSPKELRRMAKQATALERANKLSGHKISLVTIRGIRINVFDDTISDVQISSSDITDANKMILI